MKENRFDEDLKSRAGYGLCVGYGKSWGWVKIIDRAFKALEKFIEKNQND